MHQIGNLTPQIEDLTSPFRLYWYIRTYTTLVKVLSERSIHVWLK